MRRRIDPIARERERERRIRKRADEAGTEPELDEAVETVEESDSDDAELPSSILTKEREAELGRRVREGDREAEAEMVMANVRLVMSIAKKYVGRGVDFEDLVQEGCVGLMKAVRKFNPDLGYRFSTYASRWISQAVSKYVDDCGRAIRIPGHAAEKIRKIKAIEAKLESDSGRTPELSEIAEKAEMSEEEVKNLLARELEVLSLDFVENEGEETEAEFGSMIADESAEAPEKAVMEETLRKTIKEIVGNLPEKERDVIELRYGLNGREPKSLSEIGKEYGVSRERVRQIEAGAIRRISTPKNIKILQDFR